jgi:heme oxygenase (biliverdin-IX-beta and delta-forming)
MLHQLLKDETRAAHEALHTHPLLMPLGEGELTLSKYSHALEAFYQFYCHFEQSAASYASTAYVSAPVLHWLEKDFSILDMQPKREKIHCFKTEIRDMADYLGYLYVKQGSTLGGQLIAKHVHKHVNLAPGEEQFFFYGFGKETGPRWKAFLSYLEEQEKHVNQERVIAAANAVFVDMTAICDAMAERER